VASTGQIFDTTDESVAKSAGIFEPSAIYGPKLAIFGARMIMPGLEEAIERAPLGKSEDFLIAPEAAFGKREQSLVRMMPEKEFSRRGIKPQAGMTITLDDMMATIKSVTSGRVVVDFNHPLAGENVVYALKIQEVIADPKKKLEAMLASIGVKGAVAEKDGKLAVAFDKSIPKEKLDAAKSAILAVAPGTAFSAA